MMNIVLYSYPLQIRFKILAFAPRFSVTDSTGKEVFYIEQKVFALREAIKVFNNEQEKQQIYGIKTKQVIDFGAQYYFYQGTDETTPLGSIKEKGLKTIFKATYNILDKADTEKYTLIEVNPWVKVADALCNMVPYLGLLTGYFFNPEYQIVEAKSQKPILSIKKVPSFWERQFRIDVIEQGLSAEDEISCLLGTIMMVQLQKSRG